jgi:long-chain acyl-CoA synthetase
VITVAHAWRERVRRSPAGIGYHHRVGSDWQTATWRECDERVRRIAGALLARGLQPGDRVAILGRTRLDWVLVALGIQCVGAAVSTIYPSSTPSECLHVLRDAGCALAIVEDASQLAKLADWDGAKLGFADLAALEDQGARWLDHHPAAIDERIDAIRPEDLATVIYTSGTTGPPKGVCLTHDCWAFQFGVAREALMPEVQGDDLQLLFLPLAHSFGLACVLGAMALGVPTALEPDIDQLLSAIQQVRPTMLPAVPRVFEKIHHRIVARAKDAGPRRYAVFAWASDVAERVSALEEAGGRIGLRLRAQRRIADRLVFRRLRDALGGRIRVMGSGGAPLSPEIGRFFRGAGIQVVEGYGLTETSAAAVVNRPDDFRFGTVGRPVPGCELKLGPPEGDADGEILLRGRNVMRGYWNAPEATAAVLDADGWFHTGDLGRLDADGRLMVTGRKKDLIITSGGKNVAPSDIEGQIKARCPEVGEIVMLGDRRPYCVALVWPDPEAVGADGLEQRIWDVVQQVNATLPSYATIKQIAVLPEPLTPDSGLLTPSLKVKRAAVARRHADRLDRLYAG